MRDLFARWATRATRATEPESASSCSGFSGAADVAHDSEARATRATDPTAAANRVAHVAPEHRAGATRAEGEKGKQHKGFSGVLPALPMLPTVLGKAERCMLTDCLALLDDMHTGIRADYEPGALALLDTDPDLARRFHATEAHIDALAKVEGGPIEADFRAAIEAHAAIWREIIARHRAQREAAADPIPELPDDATLAVGVSYGDGKPGTWDVVRRAR